MQTRRPATTLIRLSEWQTVGPSDYPRLADPALLNDPLLRADAERLRPHVDARPGFGGLYITATSWVGNVRLGPLVLAIEPKLPALPLARLLSYAYGWDDLRIEQETELLASTSGVQDVLALLFAQSLEQWRRHGPPERYAERDHRLANPRGRIVVSEIVRRGGLCEASLPCRPVDRQIDWPLNRVLKAGLRRAASVVTDRRLGQRIRTLADAFPNISEVNHLRLQDIVEARAGLTRLTSRFQTALAIEALLMTGWGAGTHESMPDMPAGPGHLFDMNMFFQHLISRFLREHTYDVRLVEESSIRGMFRYVRSARPNRRPRMPRPDLAVRDAADQTRYLDAKYRDLSVNGLPPEWLYQLSLYAVASQPPVSTLLYASTSATAQDETIAMSAPAFGAAASVRIEIRPVPLIELANLVRPNAGSSVRAEARELARRLLSLESGVET